MQDLDIEVF